MTKTKTISKTKTIGKTKTIDKDNSIIPIYHNGYNSKFELCTSLLKKNVCQ